MVNILKIPINRVRVFLHLYSDMNINEALNFWSKILNMPIKYFSRPYIKKTKRSDLDQKGFGHGTCRLRVSDTVIKEKILMAIRVISDYYGKK